MARPSSHHHSDALPASIPFGRRQLFYAVVLLLACSMLSGCLRWRSGPRPKPPALAEPIDVLYVTDRAAEPNDPKKCEPVNPQDQLLRYDHERAPDGRLSFGIYQVAVGEGLDLGSVPQGLQHEVMCKTPPDKKKPKPALRIARPSPMPEEEFFTALAERMNATPRREMLLFIHGFNYKFAEAAERAGQLKYDLAFQGPVVIYSWPSREGKREYREDEKRIEESVETLARVLVDLTQRGRAERIHVIAHSLGVRGLTKALLRLSATGQPEFPKLGQIILAAPDMDRDALRERVPVLTKMAERVTLYVSTVDRALLYGRRFHQKDAPRAGEGGQGVVVMPEMDTVDVTAVSESFIGHSYFGISRGVLGDIYELLHNNSPPEKRFGLFKVKAPDAEYWAFRK